LGIDNVILVLLSVLKQQNCVEVEELTFLSDQSFTQI